MKIERSLFGKLPDGRTADLFTFRAGSGAFLRLTNYGGIITEWHAADRNGVLRNIVLGLDSLQRYLSGHPHFGAITGRVANRIADGKFELDGREYTLAINNGPNHLHGGLKGFDKALWEARPFEETDAAGVELHYLSADGEEGYPGNLDVTVVYRYSETNELEIEYSAVTDKATPVNLTNHSYFNLAGQGTVLDHRVWIDADRYTPVNENLIPTGGFESVQGTPLDFTMPRRLGDRIEALKPVPGGYDHNYVLNRRPGDLALAGRAEEPESGRILEVFTTEPGLQLYTGNFLKGDHLCVGGLRSVQHSGFCFETQHFPDSVHQPDFPPVILRPGSRFMSKTVFRLRSGAGPD